MKINMARVTTINKVREGDFVRFKDTDTAPVWVRQHYDRASKTCSLCKYDDANHERFCKGTQKCYVDFEF